MSMHERGDEREQRNMEREKEGKSKYKFQFIIKNNFIFYPFVFFNFLFQFYTSRTNTITDRKSKFLNIFSFDFFFNVHFRKQNFVSLVFLFSISNSIPLHRNYTHHFIE